MNTQNPFVSFVTANRLFSRGLMLMAACAIAMPAGSKAADDTWNGGGNNGRWSTPGNWTGGAPASGGSTNLIFAGSTRLSATNNNQVSEVNGITFNSGAGAFTLSGSGVQIDAGGITNNSASTQTLSFNPSGTAPGITVGAAQTWTAASGTINVNTLVQLNGNPLTLVGPNKIDFSQKISGAASGAFSIAVGDFSGNAGNVTLDANNDFGGGTSPGGLGVALLSGTLTLGNANALGTGILAIANKGSGVLTLATDTNNLKIANGILMESDFTVNPTGNLTFTGLVGLVATPNPVITITLSNTNSLIFSGGITQELGTASLTLNADGNGGEFVFTGSTNPNTYTGLTTVTGSATLLLNVSINDGAIAGNLQIDAGSTVRLQQSNQIADTSAVMVNGVLELNGNQETILELDGTTGFVRLQNGGLTVQQGIFSGTINTSGNPPGGDTITKTGTGTLTLGGNNKYAGGTLLNGGALYANNNSALGSGTLVINNLGGGVALGSGTSGIVLSNNVDVLTSFFVAPDITGTANLTLAGAVTLDTASTSGITLFTVEALNSNTLRFTGGIGQSGSGSAGIAFVGGGSTVNGVFRISGSAASTYTGPTFVTDDATLQLNNSGTNIAIPGNLQIDAGSTVTLVNHGEQIADTATVIANGLLGLNGNTETIAELDGSGFVRLESGTLIVSQGTFAGSIRDGSSPDGNLVKNGAGTLSLSGSNLYTGNTTINAGLLQVNGSIASGTTTVNAGGTLGGIGMIGGNLVNGGIVAPGDAPGTLTVAGKYSQLTAGKLVIQIGGFGAGQHDLLAVGGTATLGGALQLVRLNNFQPAPDSSLVILTAAGGVTGRFSSVDTDTIMYVTVDYQPNDVVLDFGQGSFAALAGLTPNEFVVARNLDLAANDPRNAALNKFLIGELLGNLPHDFDLISPEQLTSIFGISFSFADVQADNIENRLAEIRAKNTPSTNVGLSTTTAGYSKDDDKKTVSTPSPETPRWNLFMEGNGEFVHVNGDTNAAGYNFTTGGVTVGGDYRVCDHFTLGIMGGYADTGATLTQGGAVDVNSGRVGIYSTTYGGGFYLNTLAAGGYNSYDTHRTGLGGIAQGNTDGEEFDGLISTGYDLHSGNFTVGPIASAQYTYVGLNSFNENGSLAPLNIPSQNQESFRTKVGFKTSSVWHVNGIAVTPMVSAAWQHEYLDSTYALDSSFASGAGNVFTVTGPALGRDSVVVNAGVSVQWTPRVSTYLYYDGELGRKNYELNSVSGGFQLSY